MLLYFVNNVASRGTVDAEFVVPHPSLPFVASVWSNPAHVLVTDAEGEFIADSPPLPTSKENEKVTCMAWHPTQPTLAIGWGSGRLAAWTLQPVSTTPALGAAKAVPLATRKETVASPQPPVDADRALAQHDGGAVTACVWSGAGNFLLTASSKMRVVVWAVENSAAATGKSGDDNVAATIWSVFVPLWSVLTEAVITHAVHASPSLLQSAQVSPQQQQQQQEQQKQEQGGRDVGLPPKASSRREMEDEDECVFFLGGAGEKRMFALSEEQKLFPLLALDEPPAMVLYNATERCLAVLSVTNLISVYQISEAFSAKLLLRRKLSTPSPSVTTERFTLTMRWAGSGLLAFGCGDDRVRFFDIRSDRMYVVPHPALAASHITHIATKTKNGLLVMATAEGPLAVFQRLVPDQHNLDSAAADGVPHTPPHAGSSNAHINSNGINRSSTDPAEEWELLTVVEVEGHVDRVSFTTAGHIVVALGNGKLQILRETLRKRAWDGVAAATQISMETVVVESITGCQCLLKSTSKVRGLSVAFPIIGLWNGQQIDLYTVNESTSTASLTNFVPTISPVFAVHPEGLFFVRDANRIVFTNFQLVTIGQIGFTEAEGTPTIVDVMGDVVVAISSTNAMRLARVTGRELRPLGPPRKLPLAEHGIIVTDAKVNAQGRRVALMTRRISDDQPDSRIWVYDCDTDQMCSHDFAEREEMPDAVYWNTPEPNSNTIGELAFLLLACETHQVRKNPARQQQRLQSRTDLDDEDDICSSTTKSQKRRSSFAPSLSRETEGVLTNEAMPDLENFAEKKQLMEDRQMSGICGVNPLANRTHSVVTLFATNKGLVVHNAVVLRRYHICLVGLTIPDFLLASVRINGNPSNPEDYMIEQKRLRDFEGLKTEKDAAVLEALMKFSYYSTIGNMDEAYRCVKTIKSPTVWQSLAKMCVFSGRLDVAEVCLAQMQDGVAASALREARLKYPDEKDVHVATLACSLGLVKECEGLLRKAKRFDLITDLLLACGKFEQAQRHARRYDHIRTYPVAYKYAQFMESFSNLEAATMWYFNAKCLSTDVARIYFQNNRLNELRDLVFPPVGRAKENGSPTAATASKRNEASKSENKNNAKDDGVSGKPSPGASARATSTEKTETRSDRDNEEEEVRATFERLFSHNKELLLWWAQHSERRRQFSEALKFYNLAEDTFNVVRMLCSENPPRIDDAVDLVNKAVEKAQSQASSAATAAGALATTVDVEPVGAAYFVGLHYERTNEVSAALQYYKHAAAWRAAARVAKAHQRYGELLTLSLASDDTHLMFDSATYLELNNAYDKAVELYHRVGDVQKAIEVCIKGGLYDTMHRISTTLDAQSDPEVFMQMATHFVESGHYGKAAEMYIFAKAFPRALELCTERNVPLTDEMAEAMTSDANCSGMTEEQRTALQQQIAGIAKDQGNWNLACKKYTQLGERIKAMKMLMRGGDVSKVIFFANHSRNAEIYTLAGNFLQSQSWHTDANIYKHIVLFYTKAKALGNLISFIDAYAQLQIDENRNYYEAWRALDECVHVLERNHDAVYGGGNFMAKEEGLRKRRDTVALVVKALKLLTDSAKDTALASECVEVCSDLIKRSRPSHHDSTAIAAAIRIGDVFALLVRFYQENAKSSKDALRVIESMVKHGVEPQFYVERDLMETVCNANGRKVTEFISETAAAVDNKSERRGSATDETV
ncbi:intraflagellar transport 140 [Trypanosoma grayi]|uniref:intraflagellar transport 140 n=1 Tax=Trypanosoma grayi TaxID=71804 RepID=UPI0004F4AD79|nr:intraflagellar transport 140 [Trypanosoma grayi]KEG12663.1 intraflagellar transport 140 [Trypanosoma grayi]